jgi:predicted metal-dependent hydrolase
MQFSLPLDATHGSPRSALATPETTSVPSADRVAFVRHRWARRYILRVLDDGTLRVTLPQRGSKREAQAFVERSTEWIESQRRKVIARPRLQAQDDPAARRRAARELPTALRALAEAHGITVTRISIRNQRSRWGACSSRGSITLNWRLILVPDFVREYVMIHELMHRRELNHSKRFWRHVAAACPRVDEARRWLRTEGQQLFMAREAC